MGAWDAGPFDNDSAADFAGDLDDAPENDRVAMIRAVLTTAVETDGYWTLRATRDQFTPLVLTHVDPVMCVRKYFAADVSPHPEELQAVQPVMEFKMADPRIIDPVDLISRIDKRPNLLELTPKEFEHFIQNLFARINFDTKIFKADGDGGVDCVAYDPTPIRGGKYVIQAKLYNRTVDPTHVRDLYGTMMSEGAKSGILITTSGYGPSSYEFASGKPLQLIDGPGLLALCHEYRIPARIVPVKKKQRDRCWLANAVSGEETDGLSPWLRGRGDIEDTGLGVLGRSWASEDILAGLPGPVAPSRGW